MVYFTQYGSHKSINSCVVSQSAALFSLSDVEEKEDSGSETVKSEVRNLLCSPVIPPCGSHSLKEDRLPSLTAILHSAGGAGQGPGRPRLGDQPPPAARPAHHLPGRRPLLHQQADEGRVAGQMEDGGR